MNSEQLYLFQERVAICTESGVPEERAVEIATEQIERGLKLPTAEQVRAGFDAGFGLRKIIRMNLRG